MMYDTRSSSGTGFRVAGFADESVLAAPVDTLLPAEKLVSQADEQVLLSVRVEAGEPAPHAAGVLHSLLPVFLLRVRACAQRIGPPGPT